MLLNDGTASNRKPDECCLSIDISRHLQALINEFYDEKLHEFDYERCRNSQEYYRAVLFSRHLRNFDPFILTADQDRLAFWLNVYNLLLLHSVCFAGVSGSLKEVKGFYQDHTYNIGGHILSLDDIEHGIMRKNARQPNSISRTFKRNDSRRSLVLSQLDPRLHMGLYSACFSSPALRAFAPDSVESSLASATRDFLEREVTLSDDGRLLNLPPLFKWYQADFDDQGVIRFLASWHPDRGLVQKLLQNTSVKKSYSPYDWQLNRIGQQQTVFA
ncbi:DUF547 domain-containing protein [Endozoicomonas arenosclerae]|uniref:DUF547 domain-containing protein n=1 Tax=Endozoicomonas arenosclerae TaxID=1633495 RepID=UPI0007837030|nr:DUF547 domain-containing protein [Endozoicomonas arenosclerae]